jgi:hypothetical protein
MSNDEVFDKLIEMLKDKTPFCLVRFNDGEMKGIMNPGCTVARGDQKVNSDLASALEDALSYESHNYWIGLPCQNCWPSCREKADQIVSVDYPYKTLAVVLCNDNWLRSKDEIIPAIDGRPLWVISGDDQNWNEIASDCSFKQFKISRRNSWANKDAVMGLWKEAPANSVVMISCGPLSRVLAYDWWKNRQDCTIIDIGSTFDPFTRNVRHNCHRWKNGRNQTKYCSVCNTKGK